MKTKNEIDGKGFLLIDLYLGKKEEFEARLKENKRNLDKLIRRLNKQGVPMKMLAFYCKLSLQRIGQIIHKKNK